MKPAVAASLSAAASIASSAVGYAIAHSDPSLGGPIITALMLAVVFAALAWVAAEKD